MDRETFLDLIPAYVLGALDEAESAEFETLLAQDAEAQTLLVEYQTVADNLILTTPVRPAPAHLSADMRQRLAKSPPVARPRPGRRTRWWVALAAALFALLLGVTWVLTQMSPVTENLEQTYNEITALENAIRIAVTPAEEFVGIVGEAVVDPYNNRAVIQVNNLPEITEDQTFQLWLRDTTGTVFDGGLFVGNRGGATYVTLPLQASLDHYAAFGVSLEPAGGSPLGNQRSGPSVFRIPLGDT